MKTSEIPYGQLCVSLHKYAKHLIIPIQPDWDTHEGPRPRYSKFPLYGWRRASIETPTTHCGIACAEYESWSDSWVPRVYRPSQIWGLKSAWDEEAAREDKIRLAERQREEDKHRQRLERQTAIYDRMAALGIEAVISGTMTGRISLSPDSLERLLDLTETAVNHAGQGGRVELLLGAKNEAQGL